MSCHESSIPHRSAHNATRKVFNVSTRRVRYWGKNCRNAERWQTSHKCQFPASNDFAYCCHVVRSNAAATTNDLHIALQPSAGVCGIVFRRDRTFEDPFTVNIIP